ncbi:MAG: efflux RND transporter periplasmic adaptor subunit [Opitutaceae bacterium]|nr:efflux RND transporter periplasmic adaptor subunit [Cytophagales bacterium]
MTKTLNFNKLLLPTYVILSSVIVSCNKPTPPPQAGPIPVNLDTVKVQTATYFDQYPGNVIALQEVELRSEVSGFITGITFKEGSFVRKGQKLYEIEQNKYAAAYSQSDAGLKIAKANLQKAVTDAGRYSRLGEQGMATKQKVEYAQTDVETAKMQVASAEAGVMRARTDLNHAVITAPFEGTIGISLLRKGGYITAGQTLLNTISSDNPIAVDFVISEKEISRFMTLKDRKLLKNDSTFTLMMPDKKIYPFPGEVELIDRAVDPRTGTLKIRLRFPNPKQFLKSGMSCAIRVLNTTPEALPIIPFRAVTEQMGEFFVYVVERDSAFQHKVTVGPPMKDKILIKEGLHKGELIVVDGVQKLKNATPITIGIPAAPGAPGTPTQGSFSPAKK